jgi:hypothetical protein
MEIDRNSLNACNASRKTERIAIADVLELIARERGATVTERREEPATKGYCGQTLALRFASNGVGCMVDIDDLHGGEWSLIHWFNVEHPARNFTSRFQSLTGGGGNGRPHHKSTSHPRDWYSLAMMLDAGLMLAVRGEAFEPARA